MLNTCASDNTPPSRCDVRFISTVTSGNPPKSNSEVTTALIRNYDTTLDQEPR